MIINFNKQYKCIPPGGTIQLPKFVVLSGRNGSGKTQLFQGMASTNTSNLLAAKDAAKITVVDDDGTQVTRINYLNSRSLSVRNNAIANPTTIETQYDNLLKDLNATLSTSRSSISMNNQNRAYVSRHKLAISELLTRARIEDRTIIKYDEMIDSIRSFEPPSNIFDDQFSVKFIRYFTDKRKNKINKFLSEQEGEDVSYLSDAEFIEKFGPPPWELIGEILVKSHIPYTVTFPTHHKDPFVAELISQKDPNTKIQFSDLSSGERTLCKLALAIYHSQADAKFPELLLLDEPDSHLHPAMTKQLLDTLVDSFLPYMNIGIIVATHSPSTCALAPDGSLYHMDYDTRRPNEIDIDDALEELCIGIPTLSIRKENERQVIVESDVDAELYSQFWMKAKQMLEFEKTPTLNFIS